MKGRIDNAGYLVINRAGKERMQGCPFNSGAYCGDWCPLFSEPVLEGESKYLDSMPGYWVIRLCRKAVILEEFDDER
jgi:hypothetical protein